MGAIIVSGSIAANAVLVAQDSLTLIDEQLHRAAVITSIPDQDEQAFAWADAQCKGLARMLSDIEKRRKELKEPVLAYGRDLDATADAASQPLKAQHARLGALVIAARDKENARREAIRVAAETERQRLQAIADEEHRQVQEKLRQEAEAKRLADAETARQLAALDAVPGEAPAPVDLPPPIPEETFQAPAPRVMVPVHVPAPLKSSMRKAVNHVAVIVDDALVPLRISGAELRPVDLAAAKALMKRGVNIPGMRLDEVMGTAATGRG